MTVLNFDQIDKMAPAEVEAIINAMDSDTTLSHINLARQRHMQPDFEPTEAEIRAGILLVRRLRSMRENKSKTSSGRPAKSVAPLNDLLEGL